MRFNPSLLLDYYRMLRCPVASIIIKNKSITLVEGNLFSDFVNEFSIPSAVRYFTLYQVKYKTSDGFK